MQENTHICKVCRKPYKACNACNELKSFETWRSIACCMECYQVWMTLIEYNCGRVSAQEAKEYLNSLDLEGKEFGDDIRVVMRRIDKQIAEAEEEKKEQRSENFSFRSKKSKKKTVTY